MGLRVARRSVSDAPLCAWAGAAGRPAALCLQGCMACAPTAAPVHAACGVVGCVTSACVNGGGSQPAPPHVCVGAVHRCRCSVVACLGPVGRPPRRALLVDHVSSRVYGRCTFGCPERDRCAPVFASFVRARRLMGSVACVQSAYCAVGAVTVTFCSSWRR